MDLPSGHPTKAMENADFMDIAWNCLEVQAAFWTL
jgi:hypothetical protein